MKKSKHKIILKGIPASPGMTKGRVRILNSPKDNKKLRKGDILVVSETTPEYMPAILKASAIVTDFGGRLSHPAIVARELGIPAVIGTLKATQILKDNIMVIVDGKNGKVFQKID